MDLDMLTPLTADTLDDVAGIRHGFFTRDGGVSEGLYASLNCGFGSRDDREAVAENRSRVAAHLGATHSHVLTPYQVHSAEAVIVDQVLAPEDMPQADALVTSVPGLAIGILTADCTPVLFADPQSRVVAAAHAGWRGAVGGILEATVAKMEEVGAQRDRIIAAIGPCIHQNNYEVGDDFEANFTSTQDDNLRFFRRFPGQPRPYFDLLGYVASRLGAQGVGTIALATACTYENESKFFSFRRTTHRGEPDYGRQISAILVA
ncbi:Laccase domain protein DR_1966 [Candidatus Filomicrobium marinum]|uniref:Purine nucleoside phosphorylase n=2 Tax=Filomicrobium TaxID=119044 RepID=A0A0D6JGI0_9HYPH|nr:MULTISPECIES: peptidoglycan editing factor PgeF [Filomicrobium]CFX52084.1 Laccase domain protein DR_1966 [Candidatus Filomicrobium marinum]CPR20063.1 Laccase domain protein DR_1966 [Candidatus Filomicrobium marinum]